MANRDDGTVSVIDGASCNGSNTSGCGQAWPTVTVGSAPQALGVDELTNTIYVTNTGDNTVSVINGATCNGTNTSGCAQTPATVTVGNAPRAVGVNQVTHTIYVANRDDGTVSVIDGRRCNGADSSGCGQTPPTVAIGGFTGRGIAVDVKSEHRLRNEHPRLRRARDRRSRLPGGTHERLSREAAEAEDGRLADQPRTERGHRHPLRVGQRRQRRVVLPRSRMKA